jgi:hypothetical protein
MYFQEYLEKLEPRDAQEEEEDSCKCLLFSASSAFQR